MPLEVDDLSELVANLNEFAVKRNQATRIERVNNRVALNRAVKSFFNLSEMPDVDENSRRIFALVKFGNADLLNFVQNVGLESFGVQKQESFGWGDILRILTRADFDIKRALNEPFHELLCRGSKEVIDFLVDKVGVDINQPDSKGSSPLERLVKMGNADNAEYLIAKGADVNIDSRQQGFSPLQWAIFLRNPDEFLSKIITDDVERSEFLKISEAKFVLGLAYSSNAIGIIGGRKYASDSGFYGLIKRKISELEFEGKEQFLDVVNRSSSMGGVKISGGKIDVLKIPHRGHDARFILERDDQNNPLRLSYCDGLLPIGQDDRGQKYGEIIFEIDREKWDVFKNANSKLSEDGLTDCFAREFSSFRNGRHFDQKKLSQALSNFVVCDEFGEPKVVGRNIPTKEQNRGNCTFKSFNIVTRAILSKVNPEMVFEKDEQGNGCGAGYEVYQGYKKALIKKNLDCLLEFAHPKNQENPNYEDAVNFLKNNVFLQAVKKGDLDLMTKLEEIFIQNKIDLTEIKNYKGKDAMFFAGESKKAETINWLVERGEKSKKDSRVGHLDLKVFRAQEERPSVRISFASQVKIQQVGLGILGP